MSSGGSPYTKVPMLDSLDRIRKQPREIGAVKLADRITNLGAPPAHWNANKIASYRAEAEEIYIALHYAHAGLAERLAHRIAQFRRRGAEVSRRLSANGLEGCPARREWLGGSVAVTWSLQASIRVPRLNASSIATHLIAAITAPAPTMICSVFHTPVSAGSIGEAAPVTQAGTTQANWRTHNH